AGDVLSGNAGTNGTRQEEAVRAPRQDSILKQQLIPAINRLLGTPSLDPICKTWLESGLEQATAFLSRRMNAYRIGVLVPIDLNVFDGTDAQKIGTQILSGIVYRAYESNRKSATDHVSLFVRNSQGMDGTHLVKTANALIDQESVQLILGPIFSDQAIIVSRACAAKGVTMITPTATDEHITLGINTSFQINPTHNMRGRAIAKYLMQFPTMKTFGIFAEQKTYGVEMAEGFRQEVLSKGCSVKIYSLLQPKFSRLKEAVDTLNIRYKGKLKGYQERRLDAIYLPLTNLESIGIALSQLKFYNFSGQIVGSGDWNDPNILRRFEDLLNGVIYATDSYIAYDNPQTASILTSYQAYWQSRQAALFWNGYDALDYLIHALVSDKLSDRTKIAEALMAAPAYKTAHTEIYFGGGNINQRMNIMQYQNGTISKIQ
ncbi:MAG: amino acid ABC transporter substrate-binding protein, partial [Chlorobiales bacterium]|nr:amino acid ABC transporter substrate-binding protein [Chlorobiales bacterium]